MVAVHALVAEVLANFINALETAHDEALQVELGGNAHIHVLVERVEMGDERTGRCTAGNHLQRWRLHLGVAGLIEHAAHGSDDGGALQERFLHALVHNQVNVTLAVAQLGVVELVVSHTILVLHNGQWLERLRQQRQFLGMYRKFAGLRAEHETPDTHEVAYVEEFLEHHVVSIFVLARTDVVAGDIHLNSSFRVLNFGKASLTHHAAAHHAAGNRHLRQLVGSNGFLAFRGVNNPLAVGHLLFDVCAESIGWILGCGIGVDAHLAQLLQTLASAYLLFTQF